MHPTTKEMLAFIAIAPLAAAQGLLCVCLWLLRMPASFWDIMRRSCRPET